MRIQGRCHNLSIGDNTRSVSPLGGKTGATGDTVANRRDARRMATAQAIDAVLLEREGE